MFGDNPIRHRENNPLELRVQSMFPTIQGEGPYAGQCATFIRLAGCNLACHFCDTEFESGMGNVMSVEAIAAYVRLQPAHMQKLVVLTGGEPLRQNIALLVDMLLTYAGSLTEQIQIETAGTLWDSHLNRYVGRGLLRVVCSPKTPGINEEVRVMCRDWKYIISSRDQLGDDGLPMQGTQGNNRHLTQQIWRRPGGWWPEDTVWVSPMDESQSPYDVGQHGRAITQRNTVLVGELAMKHGYRVSLQMHKLLGVE